MKEVYDIIKSPIITEKSTAMHATTGAVAFWVDVRASKTEIKAAVEKIFNVKVESVNTNKVPGKVKRLGKYEGKTSTRKKAYIKLKEGGKIEFFEGV
ncbi:MAG: 50S ribosomal protein L23 [Deltaproteobacteria bacterium]|nr:50S ribosomal protein L23 [Deltaproteobacteria bacterium]